MKMPIPRSFQQSGIIVHIRSLAGFITATSG
jgi:hypothetical protein